MVTSFAEIQNQCSTLFEKNLKDFADNYSFLEKEDGIIHSLSNGIPGICILHANLDKLYPEDRWDYKAHKHLEILSKAADYNIMDLSLYQGISGLGASVFSLAKENRYKDYLNSLNQILEIRVTKLIEDFAEVSSAASSSRIEKLSLYDVCAGITGIVRYMIFFKENKNFIHLIKQLVEKIILFVNLEMDKLIEEIINKEDNVNLGTAHGLSGLLAILSIVKLEDIEVENLSSTIINLTAYLEKNSFLVSKIITFPEELPFIISGRHKEVVNSSWCYGLSGISRSMILASRAIKDTSLEEKYTYNYLKFLDSLEIKNGEVSTIFCHGLSGIIYEAFLMYKDSGEKKFLHHISRLLDSLYETAEFEKEYSFPDRSVDGEYYKLKVGIVDGAISVYIVLTSILLNEKIDMDWIYLKS